MQGKILLSTAYLPPAEYFARILRADKVLIEKEENYHKQSFRNRCYILSASGPQVLTVPVFLGSYHKVPVKDIRIDYSKRWQQVHLRAIAASYSSSPFFLYYYENIEGIILNNFNFLLDLNMELLQAVLKMIRMESRIDYTSDFLPLNEYVNDFRYIISPKKRSDYLPKEYRQVFESGKNSLARMSIIDLLFNMGPESVNYL